MRVWGFGMVRVYACERWTCILENESSGLGEDSGLKLWQWVRSLTRKDTRSESLVAQRGLTVLKSHL